MNTRWYSQWITPLVVAIIAALITLTLTATYVNGALQGNFRHIFLPAKMWGIPEKVASHGFDELFQDNVNAGWDGQFYFFIANDPLARADTEQHIDSNAYRYQRVGLPLLAFIVSKLTRQDWVSPMTYYLTNLGLLFLATLLGAYFLRSRGINPFWILLWTLGMGTQVTQLHGLPDGAADALQIIALICLVYGRTAWYAAAAAFAVLTREIYVLVPAAIMAASFLLDARAHGLHQQLHPCALVRRLTTNWFHLLPAAVFVGWQIFIRQRFHIAPSAQATNILDWPFKSSFEHMLAPWTGMRPMDRAGLEESIGILLFLAILLSAAWMLAKLIRKQLTKPAVGTPPQTDSVGLGLSIAFLCISLMYVCFGSTVMMAATGYWKATNIFLFLFPFVAALHGQRMGRWTSFVSLLAFALFSTNLMGRVKSSPFETQQISYATAEPACLKDYSARIRPLSIEVQGANWLSRLTSDPRFTVMVEVTNTGNETWFPYRGKGTVNVSYQWINSANGTVARDGIRTSLRAALKSGQSAQLPLTVNAPSAQGNYLLTLTLVQEGCTWFYQADPSSKLEIPYTVR